jgi:hypothetical protein
VLLGPIISRLFTCSNAEKKLNKKTKGACSSHISMLRSSKSIIAHASESLKCECSEFFFIAQKINFEMNEFHPTLVDEVTLKILQLFLAFGSLQFWETAPTLQIAFCSVYLSANFPNLHSVKTAKEQFAYSRFLLKELKITFFFSPGMRFFSNLFVFKVQFLKFFREKKHRNGKMNFQRFELEFVFSKIKINSRFFFFKNKTILQNLFACNSLSIVFVRVHFKFNSNTIM